MRANNLFVVVAVLCLVSAVFAASSHQRHIKLLSATVRTDVHPEFSSDTAYSSYLAGGSNQWKKIASSSHQKRNSETKHSYLLHFKNKNYVCPNEKSQVESAIKQLGGCFSKSDSFSFDHDSKFYAFNSYLVHCSESTVSSLKTQFHNILWIGSWLPSYKYYKLKSEAKVRIGLVGVSTVSEASELGLKLQKEIVETLKISFDILAIDKDSIVFTTSAKDSFSIEKLYSFLSHQSFVHYIMDEPELKVLNQNAAWISQDDIIDDYTVYDNDLTGAGQIVGVTDTGLDYDNCFFWDPEVPTPVNTFNPDHRKVVAYRALTGYGCPAEGCYLEDYNGHGTHVAGSIAGNAQGSGQGDPTIETIHIGTGTAPDAKLSVVGIAATPQGALTTPSDLSELFSIPYDDGARIISNSWGCGAHDITVCNVYSAQTASVDAYMVENEDVLVIFAAGNEGEDYTADVHASFTVSSPGIAKNALTVGASMNDVVSFQNLENYWDPSPYINNPDYCAASGCPNGSCTNCADTVTNCCANNLVDCCPSLISGFFGNYPNIFNRNNLASFSSRGPADYTGAKDSYRVKPDIVAPGQYIISAHSDGNLTSYQCSTEGPYGDNAAALKALQGTSMATPVTAGNAALIRQYFADGWMTYHGIGAGGSVTSDVLKALIIASADPLSTGLYHQQAGWANLPTQTPNFFSGWGRPKLGNILSTTQSEPTVFIYRDSLAVTTSIDWTFNVEAGATFKAILVWNDPPGATNAAQPLVNNLDLVVTDPSSTVYYGNGALTGNTPDEANNVEGVRIAGAAAGQYKVEITATSLGQGTSQTYALVVTGFSTNSPSPSASGSQTPSSAAEGTPTATPSSNPAGETLTATPSANPAGETLTATPSANPAGETLTATPSANPAGETLTATPSPEPPGMTPSASGNPPSASPSDLPIPANKSQMLDCRVRCRRKCKRKLKKRNRLTQKKLKKCINKCIIKICF